MSNKEAIENIIKIKKQFHKYEFTYALDLAIKALEAPTVDTYTEDDVKTAIKEGHQVGYEMAKAKYERPTGEWIEHYDNSDGFTWLTCSRCMCKAYEDDYNFCPNCGADMRKEAENE